MKYSFKRKPRAYQYKALLRALQLNQSAVWLDPGLGKTKIAIDFAGIKFTTGDIRKILIVCPLSAIGVWENEWYKDCPDEIPVELIPIISKGKKRIKALQEAIECSQNTVIVINYDALLNETIHSMIMMWAPDMLIIDEIHYCKNPTSSRTKLLYLIAREPTCKFKLGLTGTPMPKNILDVFGQYKILNDSIFGDNWYKFKNHYALFHPVFRNKPIKFLNQNEFAKRMHSIAIRVKDSDITSLSELVVKDIPVYLSDSTKKLYKQMAEEMIVQLEDDSTFKASIAAVKALRLQQITGGFLTETEIVGLTPEGKPDKKMKLLYMKEQEKLDVLKDLVENYVESHKIMIGCRFLIEIAMIAAYLEKEKIGFRIIKGGVSAEDRATYAREFQESPDCRVIIFQVSAATAITLTAGDIGILYSCSHKWDDYFQWLKRLHRQGQNKPVYILRLMAKGTVDRLVIDAVEQKRNLTELFVDKSKYRKLLTPKF